MATARPTRRLSKAPLVYTLAQVQFTPFARMKDVVADIQDALRDTGYPRFEKITTQRFQLGPQGPKVMEFEHWEFGAPDKRSGLVLMDNMIVFQTTKYTKFSDFADVIKPLFEIIKTHAKLDAGLVNRIGMRYTDVIRLKNEEKFTDFLKEDLVGPFKDSIDSRLSLESQCPTEEGFLAIRCLRDDSGAAVPPDLLPLRIEVPQHRKPNRGEWAMLLDFDHFSETEQNGFDVDGIIQKIDKLHTIANNAFFKSITERAKNEWA